MAFHNSMHHFESFSKVCTSKADIYNIGDNSLQTFWIERITREEARNDF